MSRDDNSIGNQILFSQLEDGEREIIEEAENTEEVKEIETEDAVATKAEEVTPLDEIPEMEEDSLPEEAPPAPKEEVTGDGTEGEVIELETFDTNEEPVAEDIPEEPENTTESAEESTDYEPVNEFREAPTREAPMREAPEREAPRRKASEREAPRREAPKREAPKREGTAGSDTVREAPRREGAAVNSTAGSGGGKSSKIIFIIIGVIVGLLVVAFVGFQIAKNAMSDELTLINGTRIDMYVGSSRSIAVKSKKNRSYDYKMTSSAPSVISVDNSGNVTAKVAGSATITVDPQKMFVEPVTLTVKANYRPVKISSGTVLKSARGKKVAKVELTNSSTKNCYMYFKNRKKRSNDFAVYLAKGKKKSMRAPYGTYDIYYCMGNTWYGKTLKFGDSTDYYKSSYVAKLYKKGRMIYGVTFKVFNTYGNSGKAGQNIGKDSFPK